MKKILLGLFLIMMTLQGGCQEDKTFTKVVNFNAGLTTTKVTFTDGTSMTTVPTGGTGNMVYPGAGIALSTGTAWGTSITNNSANWNAAYGWGNHAGLYRPISYVPTWAEITGKPTLFSGSYPDLTNKPTLFSGSYTDLTNKPGEIELQTAISSLKGLLPPRYTTEQINAFTLPIEEGLEVYDLTLHVKKYWNGSVWKIVITGN
jgi:hypothetical protein